MTQYTTNLLSQIGETNIKNLAFKKLKLVFLMAIRDFKEGRIKLEDLSSFVSDLVQMPQTSDDKEMKELKEVIYSCSEIGYYLRQIPELSVAGKNTTSFLLETMEYYYKNKELLEKS